MINKKYFLINPPTVGCLHFLMGQRSSQKVSVVEFPEIDSTTLMALSPYFVTGFCDAESCFNVSVSKRIKSTVGYVVQARFVIELQLSDIDLLFKIQSFFLL